MAAGELAEAVEAAPSNSTDESASYACRKIVPAMSALRELGDKLESIVDDAVWPLPAYREMLFIR